MSEDDPEEPPEVRVFRPPSDGDEGDPEPEIEEPTDVKFVGPKTAECLEAASVDPLAIPDKEVSYRTLVDAGVNPGTATRIRREHSLPWTRETSPGEDLDQRSQQVRGLQDEEAAWVAESSGDWELSDPEPAEADGSGSAEAEEAAWRDRTRPDPVTEVDGIGEARQEKLARAGITSVRSLATADPQLVADVLGLEVGRVEEWVDAAREMS